MEPSESKDHPMTKFRIFKNLMIISITIMIVEAALGPAEDLSSSINIEKGVGTTSTAVGYVFTIFAYFFLPTLVINKLGLKYSMFVFICFESIPIIQNLYPAYYTLIPGTIVQSLAGVITRPAQKTSVALLAEKYAILRGKPKYEYINFFFALYYGLASSGYVWGAIFSWKTLGNRIIHNSSLTTIQDFSTCGASFCDWEHESSAQFKRPDSKELYIYFGISALGGVLASLLVVFFFDNLENPGGKGSVKQMLLETFKIFKKPQNLLLVPSNFQADVMDSFSSTSFTSGYVTCTIGVEYVGMVMLTFSASQTIFSLICPNLAKYLGRITIITFAAILQGTMLVVIFLYKPRPEEGFILYIISGLFGLSSAIYQALISTMYSTLFPENRKAAFANFLLPSTLGVLLAYGYSYALCVWIKIILCGIFLVISYVCYLAVEIPIILNTRKIAKKVSS